MGNNRTRANVLSPPMLTWLQLMLTQFRLTLDPVTAAYLAVIVGRDQRMTLTQRSVPDQRYELNRAGEQD
jgi:hypothetical protein